MNEFSLIEHYFKPLGLKRDDVLLGIGDDAACVHIPNNMNLLVSTDTLVAGVHFLSEWDAYDIAYRSVMVNLSDLAAMAAQPCWATLALTLPEINSKWLKSFAQGLGDSLKEFNTSLIGGDTTQGPLSITLTVFGQAPQGQEILRRGAKAGDVVFVSGPLGAAALAIKLLNTKKLRLEDRTELMEKLIHPKPRLDLRDLLRFYATAAIDISDGLSADLNHICVASGVGACLDEENIPVHPLLCRYEQKKAVDLALTGGDDYELCFTVPEQKVASLMAELNNLGLTCYPVGIIEAKPGLRIRSKNECNKLIPRGYSHF
jgi:thiamine-monophosphate kinase